VYNGGSNSHPQLRSISGSLETSIVPVVSSSNSLFVWFTSDGSEQRQGFSANYEGRSKGTVKPAHMVTSIKQSPVLKGHLWHCDSRILL